MPAYIAIATWHWAWTSLSRASSSAFLRQGGGSRLADAPVVDLGEREQRTGARVAGFELPSEFFEHVGRPLEVARQIEIAGEVEPQLDPGPAALGQQPQRELGQLGRCVRRSAQARGPGCSLHRLGNSLVATLAAEGQVTGALLGVPDRVRERSVRRAPAPDRHGRVDRRGEEWVDELDPLVRTDAHEPGLLGRHQRPGIEQDEVGLREGGRTQERVQGSARQRADARRDERLKTLRYGKLRGPTLAAQEPRDLERVERVPTRCLSDPDERRAWERPAQLARQDAVERGDGQRPELEADEPAVVLELAQRRPPL